MSETCFSGLKPASVVGDDFDAHRRELRLQRGILRLRPVVAAVVQDDGRLGVHGLDLGQLLIRQRDARPRPSASRRSAEAVDLGLERFERSIGIGRTSALDGPSADSASVAQASISVRRFSMISSLGIRSFPGFVGVRHVATQGTTDDVARLCRRRQAASVAFWRKARLRLAPSFGSGHELSSAVIQPSKSDVRQRAHDGGHVEVALVERREGERFLPPSLEVHIGDARVVLADHRRDIATGRGKMRGVRDRS